MRVVLDRPRFDSHVRIACETGRSCVTFVYPCGLRPFMRARTRSQDKRLCKREIRSARPIVDAVPVASVLSWLSRFRSAARSFVPACCENQRVTDIPAKCRIQLRDGPERMTMKGCKMKKGAAQPRPQAFNERAVTELLWQVNWSIHIAFHVLLDSYAIRIMLILWWF